MTYRDLNLACWYTAIQACTVCNNNSQIPHISTSHLIDGRSFMLFYKTVISHQSHSDKCLPWTMSLKPTAKWQMGWSYEGGLWHSLISDTDDEGIILILISNEFYQQNRNTVQPMKLHTANYYSVNTMDRHRYLGMTPGALNTCKQITLADISLIHEHVCSHFALCTGLKLSHYAL